MSMSSMFLPGDVEVGVQALLGGLSLTDGTPVNVGSIGQLDIDDADELIFDPPMARTYYEGTPGYRSLDNQALTYDVIHMIQVWFYVESLSSKEEQREETKNLLGRALPLLAGARVSLSDGGRSEPIRLRDIGGVIDTNFGKIYALRCEVPGIAQFPGQ